MGRLRILAAISIVILCVSMAACKGAATGLAAGTKDGPHPTAAELQAKLLSELERLGIDPAKCASSAPTGADGAVFDLQAVVIDPDGPPDGEGGGTEPPTAIDLSWTERLVGDYDQNGEVNTGDITPLAQHFDATVTFDPSTLHGGFKYWPQGDPDAASGDGPLNWRRARIDGDSNGKITTADITPLAVHFKQSLDGYRIYRKGPGESGFTLLPDAEGESIDMTFPRARCYAPASSPNANRPVRYLLSIPAPVGGFAVGTHQYYVAPYEAKSGVTGTASATIVVQIVDGGGSVNVKPTASLKVTPDFAGAPAVITLDASASYDADGSIVEYKWDLDGDGTVDYSTQDAAPPTEVDGGNITNIVPGTPPGTGLPPTTVTATYNQGSAEWIHPAVTAVDDKDALSKPGSAQLGISGWVKEVISAENPAVDPPGQEVGFRAVGAGYDPANEEVLLVGQTKAMTSPVFVSGMLPGIYVARRHGPGDWEQELVAQNGDAGWAPKDTLGYPFFLWQENGQPMLLFSADRTRPSGWDSGVFLAKRNASGSWSVEPFALGSLPLDYSGNRGAGIIDAKPVNLGPAEFAVCVGDFIPGGEGSPTGTETEFSVYWYDHGSISIEDTGWSTNDHHWRYLGALAMDNAGNAMVPVSNSSDSGYLQLTAFKRYAPGDWQTLDLDIGSDAVRRNLESITFDQNNDMISVIRHLGGSGAEDDTYFVYENTGATAKKLAEIKRTDSDSTPVLRLDSIDNVYVFYGGVYATEPFQSVDYCLILENNNAILEHTLEDLQSDVDGGSSSNEATSVVTPSGQAYATATAGGGYFAEGSTAKGGQYLLVRVDPRR